MFDLIKHRIRDSRTLAGLCTTAEDLSRAAGRTNPGSEHFVLASLALPDRTALEAFGRLKITEEGFRAALAAQRADALASVGVQVAAPAFAPSGPPPLAQKRRVYEAAPTGQALLIRLADARKQRTERPLLAADILLVAAQETHTATARAFQKLGIDAAQLADAANVAIGAAEPQGKA